MKIKKNKNPEFWISNISNKNVSLRDLRISVPARSHINLMDKKHYTYSLEELKKSAKEGSLYLKRNMIKIREVAPPEPIVKPGVYVSKEPLYLSELPELSRVELEEKIYPELQISDESFAEELTKEEDE